MKKRFAAKYWKSGRRKGRVREPGRELPFDKDEFRAWLSRRIGFQAMPCPYCGAPIDVLSLYLDHDIPVNRGGSLSLKNLSPLCRDCNTVKGELTGREFRALLDGLRTFHPAAQKDIMRRLRAGAMGVRLRFFPKSSLPPQPQPTTFQEEL